jgi:hypothetical protein
MQLVEVEHLDDITRLPETALAIKGKDIGDRELKAVLLFRGVEYLDLSGCEKLSDSAVADVGQMASLRVLSLMGCEQITDFALEGLASAATLEELDLSFCNQITDQGLSHLSRLPALRSLVLDYCYGVSDEGVEAISRCQNLEAISLRSCEEITDTGVSFLARAVNLKSLILPEFAKLTDRALMELANNSPRIAELRLANLEEVSDSGLVLLGNCRRLRKLTIEHCKKVTKAAVEALRLAIPECIVIWER